MCYPDRITCDTYPGGEVCYTVSDAAMGWDEAFEYCRNLTPEAGILASVYNIELQNRLVEVLENISTPIWISGKTEDPELLEANTVSQWRWVYGELNNNTVKLNNYVIDLTWHLPLYTGADILLYTYFIQCHILQYRLIAKSISR